MHTLEPGVCLHDLICLGNKSALVKISERSWLLLKVNKHVVSQGTVEFYCIKPYHNLSITSNNSLNITIKSGYCAASLDILVEKYSV